MWVYWSGDWWRVVKFVVRMGLEVGDTVSAGSSVFCSISGAIGLATGESGGLNDGESVGDSPLLCVLALGV